MNSEFIMNMKKELPWIKYNEDAILHLLNQALLSKSIGSLPNRGGLFEQNYWFVLVLNELNLYIKNLESESRSR
ncbi:hypothetical protein [Borreliella burgdorferi]|uniref:hypothetical protein n=2 Tax=Borreliella burgdorferi TaxID=139 RepID=UPI0003097839|nr:hypothetical protein [Borreliella burgdorferi]MCD2309268.1 hypothetical protein [Borreliella burgdorferi]MCD2372437.1 hypothetical protein [Borreliella burgdorferi]MCD2376671.1 hypothetical protein [Borreliella burgdorferi]MCR8905540.1 hypothetical protein [Borreliella burgdorferi]